ASADTRIAAKLSRSLLLRPKGMVIGGVMNEGEGRSRRGEVRSSRHSSSLLGAGLGGGFLAAVLDNPLVQHILDAKLETDTGQNPDRDGPVRRSIMVAGQEGQNSEEDKLDEQKQHRQLLAALDGPGAKSFFDR